MDIDLWAVILWIILFVLTICYFRLLLTICWFRSNRKSQRHTFVLLFSAPAILVFMAVYGSARSGDVWAFGWALAGIAVSAPIAFIAVARLTAHYISAEMNEDKQD